MKYLGTKQINIGDKVRILDKEYTVGDRIELIRDYSSLYNLKGRTKLVDSPHPPIIGYLIAVIPAKIYNPIYRRDSNFVVLSNTNPFVDDSKRNIRIKETYGEFEKYVKEVLKLNPE
ncbi:MAG: hypothetical protein QXK76_04030 [Candidatus Woesearchaeota archaeon]